MNGDDENEKEKKEKEKSALYKLTATPQLKSEGERVV
jgi:hypothetical protein